MSQNEQFSESLTRKLMQFEVGQNEDFYVYPQSVDKSLVTIKECLDRAGGKPKKCMLSEFSTNVKGTAKPEYIITFDKNPNTILVVECKRNKKDHVSEDLSYPQKYAVDGVLYYSKYLKEEFNVIAVAISGTKIDDYLSNAYYWKKGESSYIEIEKTKDILLSPINYLNLIERKKLVKKFSIEEVKQLANKYNNLMREKLQIQPQERIMFIASCLLALQDSFFAKTYSMTGDNLAIVASIITNVKRVLENNGIPDNKVTQICNNTKLIKNYQKLIELSAHEEGSLTYFLKQLELVMIPMINDSSSHQDVLGIFYHEFIKYTAGSAGKELGIVLTPEHLCDFMCEVANLNVNDTVIDICCGTGSFLVSAMKHLISKAKNVEQIKKIKNNQLYGIEQQASIYSIAITNMILRGDGQSNIYNEDCFKFKIPENVNFSVGLLNPPYSQKSEVELEFVKKMLDLLNPRCIGVVVIPMSCLIRKNFKALRKELLENHTLKAVFSMPDDIFYPVGTNVCVMVWEAHKPHDSNISTFFGYYKDDGFVKKKNLGRVDFNNKWEEIKKEWISLFLNNQEKLGLSTLKCIDCNDEWLCEAHMQTDYSKLTRLNFEETVKKFYAYKILIG
ncbi:TPA: SAM-dependent DNA methyltransferase [Campylobacter lari]|nr:SAM-dependent DNA methyltransferase [Campylobacter lari]